MDVLQVTDVVNDDLPRVGDIERLVLSLPEDWKDPGRLVARC